MKPNKIAIVYDWIDKWGGAERVLLTLSQMYPEADFYTSYYDPKSARWASHLNIKTSFIQQLPRFIKTNRTLSVPLYPFAFESLDFSSYDLVISVTSSFAKSIITRPGTLHICYLLTPSRFLWDQPEVYTTTVLQTLAQPYVEYLKKWDYIAAQRPDHLIALSDFVCQNIKKYYNRDATVIYPPFDTVYWDSLSGRVTDPPLLTTNYYLIVSRLEPYKKIDLAIKAFNALDKQIIIIGTGSQSKKLKRLAGKNISFIEHVTDEVLAQYYTNAQALIMPQKEEFGYTALEAQFFGCPVIAYKKGGSVETIIDGKTGLFFDEQTEESLRAALEKFESIYYTLSRSAKIEGQKNVSRFDTKIFTKLFNDFIETNI